MNFIAVLTGYFFGCIQTSYILGKIIMNTDIREKGSKNAGTSNMIQTFGWKLGIITFLGDILKIILPMLIAKYYFGTDHIFNLLMGMGGILGHNFPFFMKFKGGKGTATTLGMLIILDYRICLVVALILIVAAVATDYIALASLVAIAFIPIMLYMLRYNLSIVAVSSAVPVLSVFMHRNNISNMLHKKEKKISSVFKKKTETHDI